LVFPSQICRSRNTKNLDTYPAEVTYQFSGSIEAIYASLVVRLSYTEYFQRTEQWKYAAEFSCKHKKIGFTLKQLEEGTGELEIYFEPTVNDFDKITFIRFVTDHLRAKGLDIQEKLKLYCIDCKREIENWNAIEDRISKGKLYIPCQYCDANTMIPRSIEDKFKQNHNYIEKQMELTAQVERRTKNELQEFKEDHKSYISVTRDSNLNILHISDIHIGNETDIELYKLQIEVDLKKQLGVSLLHYLVISGDIGSTSGEAEYKKAFELIDNIVKRFGLISERVIVVPGNHDVNWDKADEGYILIPKRKVTDKIINDKSVVSAGEAGVLKRDDEILKYKFSNFSEYLYKKYTPERDIQ